MNKLITSPKTSTQIDGKTYRINTDYYPYLLTLSAFAQYNLGNIGQGAVLLALVYNLIKDISLSEAKKLIKNAEAIKFVSDYIQYFQENSDGKGSRIPPLNLAQDSGMIKSALIAKGFKLNPETGLFDGMTAEIYNAVIKELDPNCEWYRVMHLRDEWYNRRHKMKDKERNELWKTIQRIGEKKVLIIDERKEKEVGENEDGMLDFKNKVRKKQGLPPLRINEYGQYEEVI